MNKINKKAILLFSLSLFLFASANNRPFVKASAAEENSENAYSYALNDFNINETLASSYSTPWQVVDNVATSLSEYNTSSGITWTITSARKQNAANNLQLTCGIENAKVDITHSISSATDENSDAYKIASTIGILGNTTAYGSAMYTNEYVNITDFQFSISNAEGGWVSVLYQVEGTTEWKYMLTKSGEESVNAVNVATYTTDNFASSPLATGKTKLAIVYRLFSTTSEGNYVTIDNIIINKTNSIANYMNVLSSSEGICSAINDNSSETSKYFSLLTDNLNGVDSSVLMSSILTGNNTSETTALDLLNYLLAYKGIAPLASTNTLFFIADNSLYFYLIIIAIVAASISSIFLIKKLKNR